MYAYICSAVLFTQAFSQDDLVALEIALEGHMDHPLCSDTPCSPKKRQRSKIEQVKGLAAEWLASKDEVTGARHGVLDGHRLGGLQ